MKVNTIDDDNIIVFLNDLNIKDIDFNNKINLEKNFRDVFLKLKHIYKINIQGYYNINIYHDTFYGAILEINHEDIEYLDYFDNSVDMRVNVISNTKFLYKIKDIFMLNNNLKEKINIYNFKNNYYLELIDVLSNYELGYLIEISELIYGSISDNILKFGHKIIW